MPGPAPHLPHQALPLFPVVSREEMRASIGDELADTKDEEPQQVCQALMQRLRLCQ